MAQARKIDLARLSIVALIEAFATAMEIALARQVGGRTAELGRWGVWLVMAASLTFLRSRLLLPSDSPEAKAAEDEAEALRYRLVSRAQVRAAADWLERRPQLGRDVFGCGTGDRRHDDGRVGDITELLRGCLVALRGPDPADPYTPRPPPGRSATRSFVCASLLGVLPDGSLLTAFLPTAVGGAEPGRALRHRVRYPARWLPVWNSCAPARWRWIRAPWTPIRCSAGMTIHVLG
jgi:segregation and condensation protein A